MGTRNLTMVIYQGKTVVSQYGQWDGHPKGQGKTIVSFLTLMDKKKFIEQLNKIDYVHEDDVHHFYRDCGADDSGLVNMDVAGKFTKSYPSISRDCGADVLNLIYNNDNTKILLNENFGYDSLFCEWCYVVDLDRDILEVYKGFNTKKLSRKALFYKDKANGKYYGVRLWKSYPFKESEQLFEDYKNDQEE